MSEFGESPDPASAGVTEPGVIQTALPAAIVPARNPVTVYDWAHADFVWKSDELIAQGFQPLSLSVYGDPENARFAGVFDKRPGPQLRRAIGYTIDDFINEHTQNQQQGFYPTLVSATGGGRAGARISGYFAQRADPTQLTIHDNFVDFGDEVQRRREGNWVPLSVTVFSDAGNTHPSMFAAIWERNTANVAWNVVADGLNHDEHQKYLEALYSGWARLVMVSGSSRGVLVPMYRDDQIGPIGQGWAARHGQTREQYEKDFGLLFDAGYYVVSLQGYGPPQDRRFASIFVKSETPAARTERMTGTTGVEAIDRPVLTLMKQSNIRGAALAIVKGTRLVYARGYTWAEPDYPTVQPTTCFRLGSGSKLPAAMAIHQLVAEGLLQLHTPLPTALPLTNPNGSTVTNSEYLTGTVGDLLEPVGRFDRYEKEAPAVAATFNTQLPVTHEQVASYMMTKPLLAQPKTTLDDFKYFLSGQVVKRARGITSFMPAIAARLTGPLQITRLRSGRSLLSAQLPDEARYHSRDLFAFPSVMTPARPQVPAGYGNEPMEMMETSGGLSAAAPDLARILAAMNVKPYTPLGRPAVDSLLSSAATNGGHGFDWMSFDQATGRYHGPKGGLLQTNQAGLWYDSNPNGFSYVILWNGLHTKDDLNLFDGEDVGWYPSFDAVLNAAANQAWPLADQFPTFGMPTFPSTTNNFRYCEKCQGMWAGGTTKSRCAAGGAHDAGRWNYRLIRNAPSPFPYGQNNWRSCTKCQAIFFAGNPGSVCPVGGEHETNTAHDWTLIHNSPYHEAETNWRWCNRCKGLFWAGLNDGICPAGGAHNKTGSGNYSVAFEVDAP
jgi:CubicO group peptidase (beta-lactamase class C family)